MAQKFEDIVNNMVNVGLGVAATAAEKGKEVFDDLAAKGATQAADALYRYRQKGVGTLLDNAFLGGVTYQSPENYRQNVQSMSETVPGTHQALVEIGEKSAPVNVGTVEKALQTRIKDAMEKKDESHQ